jgi:hypothetical protein
LNSLNDSLGEKSGNPIDLSSDDSAARVPVAGVIAIAAAVAVGALNTSSNKLSGAKEPTVAPETVSIEQSIPNEATSKTLKRPIVRRQKMNFPNKHGR